MFEKLSQPPGISRRKFLRAGALGVAAAASSAALWPGLLAAQQTTGADGSWWPLDQDWLFGGKFNPAALAPSFNDAAFSRITLPHCVARLSWRKWDPAAWRIFGFTAGISASRASSRESASSCTLKGSWSAPHPVINGHALPQHLGGYLPSRYDITEWLTGGDNVLAVAVDSRWGNVPPQGSPKGPAGVDYLEPGGIFRPVRLQIVPQVFINDLFAKPVDVLGTGRRIEVACSIDAATLPAKPIQVRVELRDGTRVLARAARELNLEKAGQAEAALTLSKPRKRRALGGGRAAPLRCCGRAHYRRQAGA